MVMDSRQVSAALEATGSSDPDVLFARREELLALSQNMRRTAYLTIAKGFGICLTIVGAAAGIRTVREGIALRRCAARNELTIEQTFSEYVATAAGQRNKSSARSF